MIRKYKANQASCRRCGKLLPGLIPCDCPTEIVPEVYWKTSKISVRKSLIAIKRKAQRDN